MNNNETDINSDSSDNSERGDIGPDGRLQERNAVGSDMECEDRDDRQERRQADIDDDAVEGVAYLRV